MGLDDGLSCQNVTSRNHIIEDILFQPGGQLAGNQEGLRYGDAHGPEEGVAGW